MKSLIKIKLFTNVLQLLVPPQLKAFLTFPGYPVRSSVVYPLFCSFHFNSLFTLVPVWFLASCGSMQADVKGIHLVFQNHLPSRLPFSHSPPESGAETVVLFCTFSFSSCRSPHRNLQSPEPGFPFLEPFIFPLWVKIGCLLSHGSAELYFHWRYKNLAHHVAV